MLLIISVSGVIINAGEYSAYVFVFMTVNYVSKVLTYEYKLGIVV